MIRFDKMVLLLDRFSKQQIKISLAEISRSGVIFINDVDDLNTCDLDDSSVVIVLGGILKEQLSIAKLKVYSRMYDKTRFIFMSNDKQHQFIFKDFMEYYPCDFSKLSLQLLTAAIVKDNSFKTKFTENAFTKNRLDQILAIDNTEEVKELVESYRALEQLNSTLNTDNLRLKKTSEDLRIKLDQVVRSNNKLLKGYYNIIEETKKINKTLEEYEGVLTSDIYQKIDAYKYSNRPFIIYFKEYEELVNQDEFLYVLYEVIQKQMQKSVKIVSLFDSNTCKKMKVIPSYYKVLRNTFTITEALSNAVAKAGSHLELLDLILTNKVGLEVLIVVDRKSVEDTLMVGYDVAFNICNNPDHAAPYELDPSNTITSKEIEGFMTYADYSKELEGLPADKRFLALSSKEIFGKIIKVLRLKGDDSIE